MNTQHLILLLIATHGLAFGLGGIYYVKVYEKAYKDQKAKNKRIIDAIKSGLR